MPGSRWILACLAAACGLAPLAASAHMTPDRIFVVVMENHSYDEVVGRTNRSGFQVLTPFITSLTSTSGVALQAFGVSQPSLPNYLALLAGNSFGIHDDNTSCFAKPLVKPCHSFDRTNLVDSLEAAGISWGGYFQSMPVNGYLGGQYPPPGDGKYRQKHNPFPYFKDVATNPKRVAKMHTWETLLHDLNAGTAPRFLFIVPDECHDMHGSTPFCPNFDELLEAGDVTLQKLFNDILNSGLFTQRSLLFLTWDEGDFQNLGCCDSPPLLGGGHIPMFVLAGVPGNRISSHPYNQYSILATIETLWHLPKLGYTADTKNVPPMFDLIP